MRRVIAACALWALSAVSSYAGDVAIFVIGPSGETAPSGKFAIMCQARANGSILAGFDVILNYTDNASQKQQAIEAEAVRVLAEIGVTVGGGDKKTVFGGPNN
jgi:hypothetical protein